MDVIEIIREAVYYPLNDTKGWGLIAAIFVVVGILQQLAIQYPDSATIFHFFTFIVSIFLAGVNLSIIKGTIDGKSRIPMFDPVKNVIDGIKHFGGSNILHNTSYNNINYSINSRSISQN